MRCKKHGKEYMKRAGPKQDAKVLASEELGRMTNTAKQKKKQNFPRGMLADGMFDFLLKAKKLTQIL